MVKRNHWTSDLKPKKTYTEDGAKAAETRINKTAVKTLRVRAYKCDTCENWHIGHVPAPRPKSKAKPR